MTELAGTDESGIAKPEYLEERRNKELEFLSERVPMIDKDVAKNAHKNKKTINH